MSGGTTFEVVGVFHDRDTLEKAMDALEGQGIDRSQLSLLGTGEAVEAKLGLPLREVHQDAEGPAAGAADAPTQEPIKRDEAGNITGLLAGIPTYIGATLAAGVTAASGGALAGVAVAALVGAAGGGAVGAGAAGFFNSQVDAAYEEQLKAGGILLIVSLKHPGEAGAAKAVLKEHAAEKVETQVVTG
jgi:hypothetical protein